MENSLCTVNLYGRVEFGHILSVAGKTTSSCKNFKINFTDGGEEIPLTIFFNLRLREIVLNSFLNSQWRETFKYDIDSMGVGEDFRVYVLVSEEKFHVALNDKHLCYYQHQAPVDAIRTVLVSGDLEKITQVDHRRTYPSPWPPIQENFPTASFSSDVPYEFLPGTVIVLKMKPSGSSDGSFFIRFNDRGTKKQLFHFNPRFAQRVIVVNTMTDSLKYIESIKEILGVIILFSFRWLKDEKRFTSFPFRLNKQFQLAIAMTSSCFKVAVDGKHLLSYDYRWTQQQLPSAFSDYHPIFDVLTGFKIFAQNGLAINVSNVDHFQLKEDCQLYENFSVQTSKK